MISIAAGILFFSSCNSKSDKKAEENKTDTTGTIVQPPEKVAGPASMLMVKHKVANYEKWKTAYDAHDSARQANGLHNYVIARGLEDSNMVMVGMKMDDVAKAKAFGSSPEVKDVMKKAGVTNAPVIDYLEAVLSDATNIDQTIRLMIRAKVKDWDAWKKAYDSHIQKRIDAGLTDRVVAHTVGDNHNVTVVFAVADLEKAKAFLNSPDLKERMKESGVEGPPDIFFYTVALKY